MENKNISRRKFIEQSLGMGALMVGGSQMLSSCSTLFRTSTLSTHYDLKGLPSVILGKTGIRVPRIACGFGSRFCNIEDPEDAHAVLNYALENGFYYWDTAWDYKNANNKTIISEERLGLVVGERRKEIFLSTKVHSRDASEAMREIETSLKRLKTDHFDILKIHDVKTMGDVNQICQKGGVMEVVQRMKEQGVAHFIGFTGHTDSEALTTMTQRGEFDTMLVAMNHWNKDANPQNRQELAIPAAKEKNMGVIMMKVVRPHETIISLKPEDLIRYALSLSDPDVILLGMDSINVLKSNREILLNFKPLDKERMRELTQELTPFYNHENLPWMQDGYRDGHWV